VPVLRRTRDEREVAAGLLRRGDVLVAQGNLPEARTKTPAFASS
jgi:hypothetical protein